MIAREDRGPIAVLRMCHGKANTLDVDFSRALAAELGAIEADTAVSGLVVVGTASIFCAGVDLKRVLEGGADYLAGFLPALGEVLGKLFSFPKPVVAAVNGHAIAGGCILVCACDHRLMARGDGRIGVPELLVGVPFPPLAFEIVRHAVSTRDVAEVVYSGATYDGERATSLGLVDALVEPDELLDRAADQAARLATLPAEAFRLTKAQLRAPALANVERCRDGIAREVEEAWRRPETLGAIAGYVKRTLGGG